MTHENPNQIHNAREEVDHIIETVERDLPLARDRRDSHLQNLIKEHPDYDPSDDSHQTPISDAREMIRWADVYRDEQLKLSWIKAMRDAGVEEVTIEFVVDWQREQSLPTTTPFPNLGRQADAPSEK